LFDLIHVAGMLGGAGVGLTMGGREFGAAGAVVGGVLGLVVGHVLGIAPWCICWAAFRLSIKRAPTERLRERLKTEYYVSHLLIAEMVVRGEPAESFWPYVLSSLRSDSFAERHSGWKNLNIWFPRMAKQIEGFRPQAPAETCREYVAKIENAEPSTAPLPRSSDTE
jgi:hypothetical protein